MFSGGIDFKQIPIILLIEHIFFITIFYKKIYRQEC